MPRIHQLSVLKFPNNLDYIPACLNYVRSIAEMCGFERKALNGIELAVEEAVNDVIKQAFSPDEEGFLEVQCKRLPTGMEITVRDQGMPLDPSKLPDYDPRAVALEEESLEGLSRHLMKNIMDEIEYRNLGSQGKELKMVRYLPLASVTDEGIAESDESAPAVQTKPLPGPISYRGMNPAEAIEVARCFFSAYGYSYIHEDVYIPEKLVARNESGDIFSAVAVAPDGEVVSHAGLIHHKHLPGIAELAMVATKPVYQGQNVAGQIFAVLDEEAVNRGLKGFFANTVTVHPYSQKVFQKRGYKEVGFFLAHSLNTTKFKGISEHRNERASILIYYAPKAAPEAQTVFLPAMHRDMILGIYQNLGAAVIGGNAAGAAWPEYTLMEQAMNPRRKIAVLSFAGYGKDLAERLQEAIYHVKKEHIEVVEAFLNLNDPLTPRAYELMHELGFIFTGIMPGVSGGDRMILQYFNGFIVDYPGIQTSTDFSQRLFEYVRSFDPAGRL